MGIFLYFVYDVNAKTSFDKRRASVYRYVARQGIRARGKTMPRRRIIGRNPFSFRPCLHSVQGVCGGSARANGTKCRRIERNCGNLIFIFISFFPLDHPSSRCAETFGYSGHVGDSTKLLFNASSCLPRIRRFIRRKCRKRSPF